MTKKEPTLEQIVNQLFLILEEADWNGLGGIVDYDILNIVAENSEKYKTEILNRLKQRVE